MDKNELKDIERKAELFYKKTAEHATEEELHEIENWLGDNDSRRQFMAQLGDGEFLMKEMEQRRGIDSRSAREKMLRRIERHDRMSLWHRTVIRFSGMAASLLIVVSATLWYRNYTAVTPPTPNTDELAAMTRIKTAGTPAVKIEAAKGQTKVVTAKELKKYNVDEDFAEALENGRKITTFVDKEYWITLDDGTIVHLNSSSRLIYPEHFGSGKRDVILDGEAYFLVAQDKSRPFIVHTPNGDIKEYGTKFHVNTNAGGTGATEVVLVEGSISVTGADRNERMLTPGTRAVMSKTATNIAPADTVRYVAWHTGRYSFQDTALGYIMDILCHWYGCSVEYSDENISRLKLSGNFDRGEDFAAILEALETVAGVRIERQTNGRINISNE